MLSTVDLEELVSPVALYPDDLLAIVLPAAAAYPLQIVEVRPISGGARKRFVAQNRTPSGTIRSLRSLNYPEVIELY